jgi:hypothetical protein
MKPTLKDKILMVVWMLTLLFIALTIIKLHENKDDFKPLQVERPMYKEYKSDIKQK